MQIEPLESRIVPATFTVTTSAFSGVGSISAALAQAEAEPGLDTIAFNLPANDLTISTSGNGGLFINSPMIFDGGTQPGYTGTPLVQLNGFNTGGGTSGITIGAGAVGSSVLGMDIYLYAGSAIAVGANNVTISGCTLRACGNGISLQNADNLTIGGSGEIGENVITQNRGAGIFVSGGSNVVIQNSYIGVGRSGLVADGNGTQNPSPGIYLVAASNPSIGGEGGPNVISGNSGGGIVVGCDRSVM